MGLFPDDCLHPCRLYLSGSSTSAGTSSSSHQDKRQRTAAEQEQEQDGEEGGEEGAHESRGHPGLKSSFEMLGGTASSGDRIGLLVYICGAGAGAGSSFGKDHSNDCLVEAAGRGGGAPQRHNSFECANKIRAGSTPRQARDELHNECHDEYRNEYDFPSEEEEEEEEAEEEGCAAARLAALLGEEEEEEDGMHVYFNLNGCPLNVPWRAVSQIAEIPWGQTALYPTISFALPPAASCPASPPPLPLQTDADSKAALQKSPERGGGGEQDSGREEAHNTVKIWVRNHYDLPDGRLVECTLYMIAFCLLIYAD